MLHQLDPSHGLGASGLLGFGFELRTSRFAEVVFFFFFKFYAKGSWYRSSNDINLLSLQKDVFGFVSGGS